ncbi:MULTISPECIES: succinylglutamate desuccinylase/aspartoacylase family protein [Mesorhizobium]|uniref:succinylglutamate desuccinylase/aspartoacylase family protein n=4 Tax=Phyllobacteriaceae TaxID=69277 RepID=UPI001F2463CF|nr:MULTISPECIES: succinylglutamate desuccinylase/aspartoacylase family protein [Mesorhizobium]MCF6121852.1 succinylglutamate desuccinylase/aspartoacylase family protein [Mesorhizobium ciceri]MCQ8812433.1 succinylglutamate desuccinylase/aspartoacylase family protein [Mesorhizobium sp. SEMIA396]
MMTGTMNFEADPMTVQRPANTVRATIIPRNNSVYTSVDFDREGKQMGFFHVPQSPHDDAWGTVRVPLAVIKNGDGPTVLIEGGNHGDEYEGPIALGELLREIDPRDIAGRIIAIPAINIRAVEAGTRTSPVDGLNFNRSFPGDFNGTLTSQIAAYVHDILFPKADYFLDLHSGGSSLMILPSAIIEPSPTAQGHRKNIKATLAFGAPTVVMVDNLGETRTSTASANHQGLIVIGSEMAGGGLVSPDALAICRRGIRNVLKHAGVLKGAPDIAPGANARVLKVPGSEGYLLSEEDGVFEPLSPLGSAVSKGDLAGRIHFLHTPSRAPIDLLHPIDGIVFAKRQPGRVRPGNCCFVLANEYPEALTDEP